jgi:hypothetical protein
VDACDGARRRPRDRGRSFLMLLLARTVSARHENDAKSEQQTRKNVSAAQFSRDAGVY